jgi:hypothetical protein
MRHRHYFILPMTGDNALPVFGLYRAYRRYELSSATFISAHPDRDAALVEMSLHVERDKDDTERARTA